MIETQLDPRQAIVAGLDHWRGSIIYCDDTGLQDQVRDIESISRMLYSVMLEAVAELDSRNIAGTAGFRNTKQLLAGMLHLSPDEAATRVAHATQLAPRRALGGEVLAPLLPHAAAVLAAGEIGPGQVRVITDTMNAIPATVNAADRDAAEADLARHARSFTLPRYTRSASTFSRTSTPMVRVPARTRNPIPPPVSCGCATAATGG
ncbi:MAG: DUF222 domain-containing protein [Pseudonocardiaceae bacterium]